MKAKFFYSAGNFIENMQVKRPNVSGYGKLPDSSSVAGLTV